MRTIHSDRGASSTASPETVTAMSELPASITTGAALAAIIICPCFARRCGCLSRGAASAGRLRLPRSARISIYSLWVFVSRTAIRDCPLVYSYQRAAEFTHLFMAVECDSLAID
jgi:hypothetical protein